MSNTGKKAEWTRPELQILDMSKTANKDFFTSEFNGVGDPPGDVGPS